MAVEIVRVDAERLEPEWKGLVSAYRRVFTLPPYLESKTDVKGVVALMADYQDGPDFRCRLGKETTHGRSLGFPLG